MSEQHLELERSLLGAVLVAPGLLHEAADHVTPADFQASAHRAVWATLLQLDEDGRAIDLVSLKAELTARAQLAAVGGPAYLAGLLNGMPIVQPAGVADWARLVAKEARRRRLARGLQALAAQAQAPGAEVEAIKAGMERLLSGSASTAPPVLDRTAVAALTWSALVAELRGEEPGIRTGLPGLNCRLRACGWRPGQLIYVGARPSRGKTALLVGFAEAAAACGRSVLYVSLEMLPEELGGRRLLAHAGVGLAGLHYWSAPERERVLGTLAESREILARPLDFAAPHVRTLAQIRSAARRHQLHGGLDLLVVDYLGLIEPDARSKLSLYERTTLASQGLKALAMDLSIPVLAAVQLNREAAQPGRTSRPSLAQFRDSGAVEQDADIALLIHQAGTADAIQDGDAEVIVAKQRNGWTGSVPVRWRAACARFESPAPGEGGQ